MSMELTELYFEVIQKAAVKANYLHDNMTRGKRSPNGRAVFRLTLGTE